MRLGNIFLLSLFIISSILLLSVLLDCYFIGKALISSVRTSIHAKNATLLVEPCKLSKTTIAPEHLIILLSGSAESDVEEEGDGDLQIRPTFSGSRNLWMI